MYKDLGFEFKSTSSQKKDEAINYHNYYSLAKIYFSTKNYDEALEACDRCLILMPDFKKVVKLRKKIVEKSR